MGLSPYHFHRVFKSVLGVTPKAYATAHRSKRVREELGKSATVTAAIYGAGFNSNGRFYATSSEVLGMTPNEFRAGGPNAEIKFAIGESSLGLVLIAASDKGVCAIFFGDDPDGLARDLKRQFPRARLVGDDPAFEELAAKVIGFVEDPRRDLDLPLDIRGTAFQHRVWEALRRIPARALPRAMRTSPRRSVRRKRCARWGAPAARTRSRWRSPATAWSGRMGR